MNNNKKRLWALVCLLILIFAGGYVYTTDPFGWRGLSDAGTQQSAEADKAETKTADTGETAKQDTAAGDTAAETAAEGKKVTETDSDADTKDATESQSGAAVQPASPHPRVNKLHRI